jgi:hypothetical protein
MVRALTIRRRMSVGGECLSRISLMLPARSRHGPDMADLYRLMRLAQSGSASWCTSDVPLMLSARS